MDAGSKQRGPKGWNSEQREGIFHSLLHKKVCQFVFLTNKFKFICLVIKGLLKPVFIGFMFVFLQLCGFVSGQLCHAFSLLLNSFGNKCLLFPVSFSEKGIDLSLEVIN